MYDKEGSLFVAESGQLFPGALGLVKFEVSPYWDIGTDLLQTTQVLWNLGKKFLEGSTESQPLFQPLQSLTDTLYGIFRDQNEVE